MNQLELESEAISQNTITSITKGAVSDNKNTKNNNKDENKHSTISNSMSSKLSLSKVWSKFSFLGNIFNTKNSTELDSSKSLSIEEKEKLVELNRQMTSFIEAELYDTALLMIKNGYKPGAWQKKKLNDKFSHLSLHGTLSSIEKWTSSGWIPTKEDISHILIYNTHTYQECFPLFKGNKLSQIPTLSPLLSQYINTIEFQKEYFSIWKKRLSGVSHHSFTELSIVLQKNHAYLISHLQEMSDVIKLCKYYNKSMGKWLSERYTFLFEWEQKHYDVNKHLLSQLVHIYFPNGIKNMVETTKISFSKDKIQELTIKNSQALSSKIDLKELPLEAKLIIDNLETIYPMINENFELLSSEQQFDVTNFMNKRIPEILNDYFSIPEKFREELVNKAGKNGKEIMIAALSNLESNLNFLLQDIGQHKLDTLSAKEKYTQNFKK